MLKSAQNRVVFPAGAEFLKFTALLGLSSTSCGMVLARTRASMTKINGRMSWEMMAAQNLDELRTRFTNIAQNCWNHRKTPVLVAARDWMKYV